MNLLYLTHHRRFKTFARPGLFARLMVEAGHRVTLVCATDTDKLHNRIEEHQGVRYLEVADLLPDQLRSGWDPVSIMRRWSAIRREDYDLIHTFETRPAAIYPALCYARKNHTPLVMDWNDWWGRGGLIRELRPVWYQKLFGGFETYFEEHFRTRARSTTVISHALGDRAQKLGVPAASIHWIPGIADIDTFQPFDRIVCREKFQLPADNTLVGFSAMDVLHDAPMVFKAMALVVRQAPRAKLVMTGRVTPGLTHLMKSHGLETHHIHLGLLPYDQLPCALAAMDIFLLPFSHRISNLGRWPNKVGDYLATGRPVITNPTGEMAQLFQDGRGGVLVDEKPEAMAEGILELINNPVRARSLGEQGRHLAETKLTAEQMKHRILCAYENFL